MATNLKIQELNRLLRSPEAAALVGPDGQTVPIPDTVYAILRQAIGYMKQGKAVSVVPIMQELTTQQAADVLGVSRPFLVGLLDAKEIPFRKTGTHRRIVLRDVLAYRERRDRERKRILSALAKRDLEDGLYDAVEIPRARQ